MIIIGMDNGVSGSIGIIQDDGSYEFYKTPTKSTISYTKVVQHITRIDFIRLKELLLGCVGTRTDVKVFLERPMVNPGMFKATVSALRALEATLIVIEYLKYSLEYIDSKQWQKELLPSGTKGPIELKKASLEIGKRLFPTVDWVGSKFKDADGILIAEWGRKQFFKKG